MARRMFTDQITDSDMFLDMPISAQAYYFHLIGKADDDGFVKNPMSIMRNVKASKDDFLILEAKKFIISFESGVLVIRHWRIHNLMRYDRYKKTIYQNEMALLDFEENKAYFLKEIEADLFSQENIQLGYGNQEATQPNLTKPNLTKLNKDNTDAKTASPTYGEFKNVKLSDEELEKLKTKTSSWQTYIEKLSTYKASTGKSYKSDYATLLNWIRKDGGDKSDGIKEDKAVYTPKRDRSNR